MPHGNVVTDVASTTSWGKTNQPTTDCQKGMPAVLLCGLSFKRQQVSSDCTHLELSLLTATPSPIRGSSRRYANSWKRNPAKVPCLLQKAWRLRKVPAFTFLGSPTWWPWLETGDTGLGGAAPSFFPPSSNTDTYPAVPNRGMNFCSTLTLHLALPSPNTHN